MGTSVGSGEGGRWRLVSLRVAVQHGSVGLDHRPGIAWVYQASPKHTGADRLPAAILQHKELLFRQIDVFFQARWAGARVGAYPLVISRSY